MAIYAGQRKAEKDIERILKGAIASSKHSAKKAKMYSIYYYAKLLNKNKLNKDKQNG